MSPLVTLNGVIKRGYRHDAYFAMKVKARLVAELFWTSLIACMISKDTNCVRLPFIASSQTSVMKQTKSLKWICKRTDLHIVSSKCILSAQPGQPGAAADACSPAQKADHEH